MLYHGLGTALPQGWRSTTRPHGANDPPPKSRAQALCLGNHG